MSFSSREDILVVLAEGILVFVVGVGKVEMGLMNWPGIE